MTICFFVLNLQAFKIKNNISKKREIFNIVNELMPPRRERDSNPRYPFGVHTLSRRASSATPAPLQCFLAPDFSGLQNTKKI